MCLISKNILIHDTGGTFKTKIHWKETNTSNFLNYYSDHSISVKRAATKYVRYGKKYSTREKFIKEKILIKSILLAYFFL